MARLGVEELNLPESAARFLGRMTQCEGAAVAAREEAIEVGPYHCVNCTAGDLLNFLRRTEQVQVEVVIVFIDHRVHSATNAASG